MATKKAAKEDDDDDDETHKHDESNLSRAYNNRLV